MSIFNPKVMFIFPGQGSQYKGMGSDIYREFKVAQRIYQQASDILGYDVAKLSFEDPEGKLDITEFTQPALLTHAISCLEVFKELTEHRITPAVTAGHSLGEYAALVAAGSLTFERALRLVKKRGELMSAYGEGKMVALKMDLKNVKSFVNSFYCDVGGCNLPEQTVVGGAEEDLSQLKEYVKSKFRIRARDLNTEGAFHTYLMIEAAKQFRPILDATALTPPEVKVLSNFTADYHSPNPPTIKSLLFFQLFNPVKWIWGMQKAFEDGINVIIEFGGGIGNETASEPAQKRPNLESITRKALEESKHHSLYLPAINSATIKEAARGATWLFSLLEQVVEQPADEQGNAVDENWFHLFIPIHDEIFKEHSIGFIRRVEELGLGKVVQLVVIPADQYQESIGYEIVGQKDPQPCLELFSGCESAAFVPYWGNEIESELSKLRKRLENPGYGDKMITQAGYNRLEQKGQA
jgi:malonyl CoA-acyl carrier protein transacylase